MSRILHSAKDLKERGFQLRTPPATIICFDPAGDGADHDALVAVSREEHQRGEPYDPDFAVEMLFRVLMAHRMPRDWEFPDKLAALLSLDKTMQNWTRKKRHTTHVFGIETNGVGYGYASSMARKTPTKVLPYATVGSVNAIRSPQVNARFAMPRLESLSNLRVHMETGYVKIVPGAPGVDNLETELNAFVWRGHNRPEAMEGQHDDLVMALTGAIWIGSKVLPPVLKQVKIERPNFRAKVH